MARRKKTTEEGMKKGKRVNLAVRVAAKPAKAKDKAKKKAVAAAEQAAAISEQEEVIIPEISLKKDPVNVEKQKQMIMWVGVTFFMVVIVFFWLFNISSVFKIQNRPTDVKQFNLDEISARFSESMNTLSGELGKLQENVASSTATTTDLVIASSTASSFYAVAASSTAVVKPEATATGTISQTEVEALKARLLELERKLEAQNSAKSSKAIR